MSSRLQDGTRLREVESLEAFSADRIAVDLAPTIAASLRRVLGCNDPDYEDLLQSALERVFTTLRNSNFRGECSLSGWAAVIARNVAVDALRARCRQRGFVPLDGAAKDVSAVPFAEAGPDRLADARQQLQLFYRALGGLRPTTASVVYLHYVVGHDLAEIAAMLSISVAAAQSRLVRGRRETVKSMDCGHDFWLRGPPARRRVRITAFVA
jgi:RNA polymerase sigma-70 factor (ECF subfamily)